jgi:ureidoacrylate peracid hydrolase
MACAGAGANVPAPDETIFRKTSSNVFVSTNIDYVMRKSRRALHWGHDPRCVASAVREPRDLGYPVTLLTDA